MPEEKKYTKTGYIGAMGKSQLEVVCECGYKSYKYLWSWAGHGKTFCPGEKGINEI